jgi:outer membrane protein assembly factor BamB
MSDYTVFTADDEGIIYAVNPSGELEWYRDKARDGVSGYNSWVSQLGAVISLKEINQGRVSSPI